MMMMMTIRIEPVRWDNETQCRHYFELIRLLASDHRKQIDWQQFQLVIHTFSASTYASALIAYDIDSGLPLGALTSFELFSTFYCGSVFNVHDIVVHQSARGKGVGKLLMTAFEANARKAKAAKLTLEVFSDNKEALAWYNRLGFTPNLSGINIPPCTLFLEKILTYPAEEPSTAHQAIHSMKEPLHHA